MRTTRNKAQAISAVGMSMTPPYAVFIHDAQGIPTQVAEYQTEQQANEHYLQLRASLHAQREATIQEGHRGRRKHCSGQGCAHT